MELHQTEITSENKRKQCMYKLIWSAKQAQGIDVLNFDLLGFFEGIPCK